MEYSATTIVIGFAICLSLEIMSRVTTLPLSMRWSKEDKQVSKSITEMSQKVREGKHHHSLNKLIVLNDLNHMRIHVLWNKCLDMDRETFIETQALKPG